MLAANPAHARAFATSREALVGRGLFEVFPAAPDPSTAALMTAIRASLDKVLATGKPDQMPMRPYMTRGADGAEVERFVSATNTPILADGRVIQILSSTQDVTGEVMERRGEEARRLLMREVDHRARNALTIVQSFLRLTTADTLEQFRRVVDGRVEALARAQTSLAARRWEGADLAEIIRAELAALSPTGRYEAAGPAITLPPEHVQAMSMAIHELATNACKYGALSAPGGALAITWTRQRGGRALLTWSEAGGPPVTAPVEGGFGSRLIASLARQLGGEIVWAWRPEGLQATLTFEVAARAYGKPLD